MASAVVAFAGKTPQAAECSFSDGGRARHTNTTDAISLHFYSNRTENENKNTDILNLNKTHWHTV